MGDDLRMRFDQAAAEQAFLDRLGRAGEAGPSGVPAEPAAAPAVSLMITNRQRAALRALGFSREAIRQMTPVEAHRTLGLTEA